MSYYPYLHSQRVAAAAARAMELEAQAVEAERDARNLRAEATSIRQRWGLCDASHTSKG